MRDQGLTRGVGLWSFTGSIVNGVVGAGIFGLPAAMAAAAGGLAPLAYLAVAVVMGAVVICFAEAGSRVPTSGGAYGTVEAAFGKGAGFLTGMYMWLASVLACGGIAAALCDALAILVPALSGISPRLAILAVIFVLIPWVNVRSTGLAAAVIAWGTLIKLVPLAVFVLVGGAVLLAGHDAPVATEAGQGGHFAEAMILALFAFCGMETPLGASGEVSDPVRTVPRATILAMLFVLVLYVAIQMVAQGLLGPALGGSAEPLADGMRRISPALGLVLLAGGILSRFVWIGSDILGAPRVLFAFARDGMLPAALGRTHPRFATPHVAIWVHSLIAVVLAATGTFTRLAILSTLATAGLYFLACAAALALRRRDVAILGQPLTFRVLPVAAALGMVSMVVLIAIAKWAEIAGFVAVTISSLALYAVMRPRR
ncbi:amino acid permease [uncultured Sphingomonas sp.]|uniref:APC family permease n=1 Tax=uncultured Sphingomonas sp. TaxID=158754 RepID=UPI0025F69FB8|nr:amino acid permease [uncultured Sphingomonas sp.]